MIYFFDNKAVKLIVIDENANTMQVLEPIGGTMTAEAPAGGGGR